MENRRYLLLGLVVLAAVGGAFPSVWAEEPTTSNPRYYILVESFGIELSTQALLAVGADIVDRSPDGLSVAQLSRALKEDKDGRVLSGLKVNVCSAGDSSTCSGSVKDQKQELLKIIKEDGVCWDYYSSERELSVECKILNPKEIQIEYVYNESAPIASPEGHLPALTCFNLKSRLLVRSGMPTIMGASQVADKVEFVLLLATYNKPAADDKSMAMSMTLEQAQKAVANWVAENQKSVSKFNALEWGELLPRNDGAVSVRCKYELTYLDTPEVDVLDQMIFFDKDGNVDTMLHLQPPMQKNSK